MPQTFKDGEVVRYRASFLKSVGWITDVPDHGTVLSTKRVGSLELVKVQFPNDGVPRTINAKNLIRSKDSYLEPV